MAAAVLLAGAAAAEAPPAAGGVELFRALERASAAVVARVGEPRALDGESYAAEITVETAFSGPLARGEVARIAWEELARARPVRFGAGDRVLLALEPLPGASIWRQRLPDPKQRQASFGIGERGNAFARDPSVGAVQLVEHFLALPPELREKNPGVSHLVLLAESAGEQMAAAAVSRLSEMASLDSELGEISATRFVAALLRDPPELSEALLELVERQKLESLRAPLSARAAADGSGPAPVYEALGRLDGELPEALTRSLIGRVDSAPHRAVGARYAGTAALPRLARLLRGDGAPQVRVAAVARLVELRGAGEIDRVLYALDDEDESVRVQAMLSISELGADAVPPLLKVIEFGSSRSARTAVGALRAGGAAGARALAEIADSHPDESVRALARISLGRPIGHTH